VDNWSHCDGRGPVDAHAIHRDIQGALRVGLDADLHRKFGSNEPRPRYQFAGGEKAFVLDDPESATVYDSNGLIMRNFESLAESVKLLDRRKDLNGGLVLAKQRIGETNRLVPCIRDMRSVLLP
jgi:hypothetical protein